MIPPPYSFPYYFRSHVLLILILVLLLVFFVLVLLLFLLLILILLIFPLFISFYMCSPRPPPCRPLAPPPRPSPSPPSLPYLNQTCKNFLSSARSFHITFNTLKGRILHHNDLVFLLSLTPGIPSPGAHLSSKPQCGLFIHLGQN